MDPLTQGIIGVTFAKLGSSFVYKRRNQTSRYIYAATICGLIGGMAPDLDILIRSQEDPILFLEYHRQFTHSLVFIPIGGFLCGLFFHLILGRIWKIPLIHSVLFAILGYATHGLLDAATSYGTLLFWPFSDIRIAWSIISIIDPLFTLPIICLILIGLFRKSTRWAKIAMIWAFIYLSLGIFLHHKALMMGKEIAKNRQHAPIRIEVKPSFANLLIWKVIYHYEGRYFVDAVRVAYRPMVFAGESITQLDVKTDFPWLDVSSQQAKDIERFRWFSQGYLAVSPFDDNVIIDLRYSLLPNEVQGLWGILLNSNLGSDEHVRYITSIDASRNRGDALNALIDMLFQK